MKKLGIFLGSLLLILPVIYSTLNKESDIRDNLVEASEIQDIPEETKFLLIGNRECGACNEFVPTITKSMKESDVDVYYLDTENSINSNFLNEKNINVTPTLLELDKNNQVVNRYEGVINFEDTMTILTRGEML